LHGLGAWSIATSVSFIAYPEETTDKVRARLERLLNLRGVTFEYADPVATGQMPGVQLGMVAQDVEQVFPSWVDTGADGTNV
jgi:Chaperone of endosialidase